MSSLKGHSGVLAKLSAKEFQRLLHEVQEEPLLTMFLSLGWRRGELKELKWSNVLGQVVRRCGSDSDGGPQVRR